MSDLWETMFDSIEDDDAARAQAVGKRALDRLTDMLDGPRQLCMVRPCVVFDVG